MNSVKVVYLASLTAFLVALFLLIYFNYVNTSVGHLIDGIRNSSKILKKRLSYRSGIGYVLATHYSDQLTGSMWNTLSLQCWASTLPANMKVVEPFLHYGSLLGVNLNPYQDKHVKSDGEPGPHYGERQKFENTVKLSDIVNITEWNEFAARNNFAPLIDWSYFIEHMPKKMIIVDKICISSSQKCMVCEDKFFESKLFATFAQRFAKFYKVELIRKVCYEENSAYSEEDFFKTIYGTQDPSNTIVIFNHFGGLTNGQGDLFRIGVALPECDRGKLNRPFGSSSTLLNMSSHYMSRYMPKAKLTGYIAVMVRLEKTLWSTTFKKMSKRDQILTLHYCLDDIVNSVNTIKQEEGIEEVFVATDVGPYGSAYTRGGTDVVPYKTLTKCVSKFYSKLLGDSAAMSASVKRYKNLIPVDSPGYVAQLEKIIASNATCLVLAGGGAFQDTVAAMFKGTGKKCLLKLGNCFSF